MNRTLKCMSVSVRMLFCLLVYCLSVSEGGAFSQHVPNIFESGGAGSFEFSNKSDVKECLSVSFSSYLFGGGCWGTCWLNVWEVSRTIFEYVWTASGRFWEATTSINKKHQKKH